MNMSSNPCSRGWIPGVMMKITYTQYTVITCLINRDLPLLVW